KLAQLVGHRGRHPFGISVLMKLPEPFVTKPDKLHVIPSHFQYVRLNRTRQAHYGARQGVAAATSCDRRLLRRTHGQFRGRIAWLPPGRLAQSRGSSSATFGSVTPEGRGPTKQVRARF